jgi:NAD-dependent SIR2 family protein deacetylase
MTDRSDIQKQMREKNSLWESSAFKWGPDGDALLTNRNYTLFCEPVCASCRGVVKPDVVFFGEAVPKLRVQRTTESILRSDALLVVGSSLMVWSGYRFARKAVEAGKSLAIVNRGRTRADDIATELFNGDCEAILSAAVRDL